MRIQQAAYDILKEENRPLPATDIAKRVLEKGMKSSDAKDPIASFAQTIEKNIRDGIYNDPKLIFIHNAQGRFVGLPSWEKKDATPEANVTRIQEFTLKVPVELFEKIQLATQAKIAKSFEETVILLLKNGLTTMASKIKEGLSHQLKKLDEL
jgi:hypothetical protein